MIRKVLAEAVGTCLLVFFGTGVATLVFGFYSGGFHSGQATIAVAAGVLATAFAFGLTLLILVYAISPISGCHVNPAVTLGMLLSRRMTLQEAGLYWVAQFVGGIIGSLLLWAVVVQVPGYARSVQGLGADGWGPASSVHIGWGGAFLTEVILTMVFVFIVLMVTGKTRNAATAGLAIGLALTAVHLVGIPITGTSVNPARSLGPALIVGGTALRQVWLFIIAPLIGAVLASLLHRLMGPDQVLDAPGTDPGTRVPVPRAASADPSPSAPRRPR